MDQTGIADNIIEMNELQMQGADVFMSTFAHLKGFPFFSEISNWFMPFMTNHTAVIESLGSERWSKDFANILHASAFLCNSDKYSLCLSLSQAPASQRQMIAAQFSGENLQMQEEAKAELYRKSRERSNISNRYIQDLYRFIKLNRYRSEFFDIFAVPINKLLETGHIRNISIRYLDEGGKGLYTNFDGTPINYQYGDANVDGRVDLADLVAMKKYAVDNSKKIYLAAANVDKGSSIAVTANDIAYMQNFVLTGVKDF
jgi:hypothetical protein